MSNLQPASDVLSSDASPSAHPSAETRPAIEYRLNIPFLLGSLVVFALLGAALFLIHWWQLEKTASAFLVRADQLEKDGQFFDAADNVQRYVQLVPSADKQRLRLASLYEQGIHQEEKERGIANPDQVNRAISLIRRAIGTGIKEEEPALRRKLAALLLKNRRFAEARAEAERLQVDLPNDADLLRIRALALWGLRQTRSLTKEGLDRKAATVAEDGRNIVIVALEDARDAAPGDIDLAVGLASAYHDSELKAYAKENRSRPPGEDVSDLSQDERAALALRCLDAVVTARSTDARAYLARHNYRQTWGVADDGADLQKALELAPQDVDVLLTAGREALRKGAQLKSGSRDSADAVRELKSARKHYSEALAAAGDGDKLSACIGLGDAELALDRPQDAIKTWKDGLAKHLANPNSIELQVRLAGAWLGTGELAQAEKMLADIDSAIEKLAIKLAPEAQIALGLDQDLRRALLHMQRNESGKAIPFLKRVVVQQERLGGISEQSVRALLMLGAAYAAQNDWSRAAEAYDQAAAQRPDLAAAHLAASSAWLRANGVDLAVDRAERAVQLASTCQHSFALATALLQQQLQLPPGDRIWNRVVEAGEAAKLRAGDGTMPEPWRIDLLLADCTLLREDGTRSESERREAALDVLRTTESQNPDSVGLLELLPLLYQRIGAVSDSDRSCDRLASLDAGKAGLVRVRLLSMRGEYKAAESALKQAMQQDGIDPIAAEQELISLKLAQKDIPASRVLLEKSLQQSPHNLEVLRRLAQIDLEKLDLDKVKTWEAAMLAAGPAGEAQSLFMGIRRILVEASQAKIPAEREKLLLQAADAQGRLMSLRPTWAEAAALSGLLEEALGHAEQAISYYQRAISLGDDRITVYERLIGLLERNNRSADAAEILSRMRSTVSLSQELTVFRSNWELRRNDIDEAIAIAQQGVEEREADADAHAWLGKLLLIKRQDGEALQALQKAIELKPEDVRHWNALFDYYLRVGRHAEARQLLSEMQAKVSLSAEKLNFVLAQGYEALGERELAREAYDKALEESPKNLEILVRMARFYRRDDIEKAVELAGRAYQLEPASIQTRRTLAELLSERGKDGDWAQVNKLLSDPATEASIAIADNRYRVALLARKGGVDNLNSAVRIVEELIASPETQRDEDRLVLSQLYEQQARIAEDPAASKARLEKALAQLTALGERSPPQPAHLITLIEFAQRHPQHGDASKWLDKLTKSINLKDKPSPTLLMQVVRLALLLDNTEEAAKHLTVLEELEPDALSCISLKAQLLDKRGQSDQVGPYIESAAARLLAKVTRPVEKAAVCQGIGDLFQSRKQLELAETWYRKLAEMTPEQFDRLALCLAAQGKIDSALEVCLAHSGERHELQAAVVACNVLASESAKEREYKQGEAFIAAVRQKYPADLRLLTAEATLRVIQGKTDKSLALFEELVKQNDRDPLALNNLATMLAEVDGRRDEALRHIEKALQIAGREPSLLDTKGTILLFDGKAQAAVENLEAAAREADSDPRYRFHLALAYQALKRTQDAKIELQRAVARDLEKQILTSKELELLAQLRSQLSSSKTP